MLVATVLAAASLLPLARRGGYYVPELDIGAEGSIAAWLSSSTLLGCAAALLWISRRDRLPLSRSWVALALVFTFLSLDEAVSLHEKAIDPLQESLDTSGPLLYAWVIPGALFAVLAALAFVPLLRALEPATALRFVVAGAVYVGGALGFEVLSGALAPEPGVVDHVYEVVATTEEWLEMVGITLFLAALARHAATLVVTGTPGPYVGVTTGPGTTLPSPAGR